MESLKKIITSGLLNFKENRILIVDGGTENQGSAKEYLLTINDFIQMKIAQKDIIFSNSIIEACNKTLKYHYLYRRNIKNTAELKTHLEYAVHEFNHTLPNAQILGLTPDERFYDKIPEDYSVKIQQAR